MNTFLAANSCDGFYSLFSQMTGRKDHNILLIKGGPGTGKSSMMKKIADAAEQKDYTVERMHCSSDPNSLDGIYIAEKKLILLDATAPHCADPIYPGAVEQILPLGEYWDRDQLIPHRRKIIELTTRISDLFRRVYHLLAAAGQLRQISDEIIKPAFENSKADKMLSKFLSNQAAVPTGKTSKVEERFVSALSANGHILYEDVVKGCKRVLLIEDSYDSGHMLTALADQKLEALGYDRLLLRCPLEPSKIDHIILPELGLGILLQNARLQWQSELPLVKSVHMRQFIDSEIIAPRKNKLTFGKRMCKALYDEVSQLLESEKALHDELEQYYISAMDFEGLNAKTEQLICQLI